MEGASYFRAELDNTRRTVFSVCNPDRKGADMMFQAAAAFAASALVLKAEDDPQSRELAMRCSSKV